MLARALALLMVTALPALSADWKSYANPRFGYSIDLPASFRTVNEAENGDGMTLESKDGKTQLLVFGASLADSDLDADVTSRKQSDQREGWSISYDKATESWASYSGTRNNRILYVRAITLCDGAGGYFTLDYPKAEARRYDAIVSHLVKTLKSPQCG